MPELPEPLENLRSAFHNFTEQNQLQEEAFHLLRQFGNSAVDHAATQASVLLSMLPALEIGESGTAEAEEGTLNSARGLLDLARLPQELLDSLSAKGKHPPTDEEIQTEFYRSSTERMSAAFTTIESSLTSLTSLQEVLSQRIEQFPEPIKGHAGVVLNALLDARTHGYDPVAALMEATKDRPIQEVWEAIGRLTETAQEEAEIRSDAYALSVSAQSASLLFREEPDRQDAFNTALRQAGASLPEGRRQYCQNLAEAIIAVAQGNSEEGEIEKALRAIPQNQRAAILRAIASGLLKASS